MKKMAILSTDSKIVSSIRKRYPGINIYNDYFKLIISLIIKKYPVIIIDGYELPIYNENRIISAINGISFLTQIIFISRSNEAEYQQRIRDRNFILAYIEYPVNMYLLDKIIDFVYKKIDGNKLYFYD